MRANHTKLTRIIANTLYQFCQRGISIDKELNEPKSGYMVGGYAKALIFDNVVDVSTAKLQTWIEKNPIRKDFYYGAWVSDGKVYFDISKRFTSKTLALAAAKKFNEIAIWDLNKSQEVKNPYYKSK